MSENKDNYSKVEREILDILDDMETESAPKRPHNVVDFRRPSGPKTQRSSALSFRGLNEIRYAFTPGRLMLVMLAAIVGAVFLQDVPFASPILIGIATIALIGVFFARSRPSTPKGFSSTKAGVKRWRGRDIDLSNRG